MWHFLHFDLVGSQGLYHDLSREPSDPDQDLIFFISNSLFQRKQDRFTTCFKTCVLKRDNSQRV